MLQVPEFRLRRLVVIFSFALGGLLGCGSGDGPKTVPVSGTVYLDGKPLADAGVYFMHEKFTGFGRTDSKGTYELVQGAFVGENRVYITKTEGGKSVEVDPEEGMDMEQLRAAAAGAGLPEGQLPGGVKELVPAEYSDPVKTKLTFVVPEKGASGADFRLR